MTSTSQQPAIGLPATRSAHRGYFLWPLAGYFLLFAAWAVANPYGATPDESAHIQNAYAVASGQILGPLVTAGVGFPGVNREIPQSLVRPLCFEGRPTQSAECAPSPGGDETRQQTFVHVGRYNPLYYLAVGLPIRFSPDMTGIILGRLINAAIMATLFGWATYLALLLRHRAAVGGILVALTPATDQLGGAINPNGPEIAAGAALMVALTAIVCESAGVGARRSTWWLAGLSAGALLVLRSAGPAWLLVIAGVMLIPLTRQLRRAVLSTRRFWMVTGALAVTGVAGFAWTVWRRASAVEPGAIPNPPMGVIRVMEVEIFDRWRAVTPEFIGVLSWGETQLPSFVYIAWWMAIGVLVLLALAVGRPVDRWRIIGLAGLGMLVPSLLEAIMINEIGFINAGRYFLPMLIGVPILSAYVIAERGLSDVLRRVTRILVTLVLPMQFGALVWCMIRYQKGLPGPLAPPSLNPFAGPWHPALGSATPLLLGIASTVLFFVFYWRVTARPKVDSGPDLAFLTEAAAAGQLPATSGAAVAEKLC